MARVYSSLLIAAGSISPDSPPSYYVPDGAVVVVRDLLAINTQKYGTVQLDGLVIFDLVGCVVWGTLYPQCLPHELYHWSGRQVLEGGDGLSLYTTDEFWALRVSGYVLTTP